MNFMATLIALSWVWRVGYKVIKTRIIHMHVPDNIQSWACFFWPVTVALWLFTSTSNATAHWLLKLMSGEGEPETDPVPEADDETIEETNPGLLLEAIPD